MHDVISTAASSTPAHDIAQNALAEVTSHGGKSISPRREYYMQRVMMISFDTLFNGKHARCVVKGGNHDTHTALVHAAPKSQNRKV